MDDFGHHWFTVSWAVDMSTDQHTEFCGLAQKWKVEWVKKSVVGNDKHATRITSAF